MQFLICECDLRRLRTRRVAKTSRGARECFAHVCPPRQSVQDWASVPSQQRRKALRHTKSPKGNNGRWVRYGLGLGDIGPIQKQPGKIPNIFGSLLLPSLSPIQFLPQGILQRGFLGVLCFKWQKFRIVFNSNFIKKNLCFNGFIWFAQGWPDFNWLGPEWIANVFIFVILPPLTVLIGLATHNPSMLWMATTYELNYYHYHYD